MIEYKIVTSSSRNNHPAPKGLEDEVVALIREGFVPHGTPFIFKEAICQAMIKTEPGPSAALNQTQTQ